MLHIRLRVFHPIFSLSPEILATPCRLLVGRVDTPQGFWAKALFTVVQIVNMSLSTPLGLPIPQDISTGNRLNYEKLRIFGGEAFALVPKDDCDQKLEPGSRNCIVLGYGSEGEFSY